MDRGLARLCWRCPGLRLHSTQSIHRFINGGEGFDTLKKNGVLDDRGAFGSLVVNLIHCFIMEDFGQARSET